MSSEMTFCLVVFAFCFRILFLLLFLLLPVVRVEVEEWRESRQVSVAYILVFSTCLNAVFPNV